MKTSPRVAARALLVAISGYQALRASRPSPCRYWPSCSEYAAEAIGRFGAWRGTALAVRRLARCHPWGGKGVDPVPELVAEFVAELVPELEGASC